MKTSHRLIVAVVLFIALFAWYVVASDYGDGITSGTYGLNQNGDVSTLLLKPDHTFYQEVNRAGKVYSAAGTWRRVGGGGVTFSKEFLVLAGEEPSPDGTSFADIEKPFGVLFRLRLRQYHVLWYGRTDPTRDDNVGGTYKGDVEGISATLVLNADHTFEQSVSGSARSARANGTWKTRQNGEIEFSREFLKTSGLALSQNETAIAINPKGSNLQIEIAITPEVSAPTYRKRQFLFH
jgi:hypothetical protein